MSLTTERVVCDRYRLTSVLGRGGMGVVWRARDERLQRDVAIKEVELPPSLPEQAKASAHERALREARAAARLSHPAAVTIFDVQQEQGKAYLVMELVEAPTLGDVLDEEGPMTPERSAEIALDVLDALETAHAAGIVHRDVKPANVMVPPAGPAKLADFGIASLKDDPKITQTGLILGSPSFMAPEQADGRGSGPEADLWALGATLYFAVEGAPPFDAGQAIPTLAAVLHDDPRPMQRAGALGPAISALLDKDPERRPSHGAIRTMLEDVVAGRAATGAVTARPPREEPDAQETAATPEEPRRRRTGLLVAAAAFLLLLVVAGALAWSGGDDSPEPRRGAAAEDKSGSNKGSGGGAGDGSSGPSKSEDTTTTTSSSAPEGWTLYENPSTGWSIAYPDGWEITEDPIGDGSSTQFNAPDSGAYLRVDWKSPPGESAVGAWEEYEPGFAADHEGYERIRLEPTTFKGFEAATWEFTWEEGGGTIHAVDLGFIVRDDYGFALNFVAPDSQWSDYQDEFATFQETFVAPS